MTFDFEHSWRDYNEFTVIPTVTVTFENGQIEYFSLIFSVFAWKFGFSWQ